MAIKTDSLGAILEQMELIAVDTRKVFAYDKSRGLWAWYNNDEVYKGEPDYHGWFKTRFDALVDATEPYIERPHDGEDVEDWQRQSERQGVE